MNPGFEKRKDPTTICAACKHCRRMSDADVPMPAEAWRCDVTRTMNVVSGKATRDFCAVVNNGNCAQYEEAKA